MSKWWQRAEILLSSLLAVGLALLILVQVGLYLGKLEPENSWLGSKYEDGGEYVAVSGQNFGQVSYELVDYSRLELAQLCKNGVVAAEFDQPEVKIKVYSGDVLTLNVTAYNRPIRVRLKNCSLGIEQAYLLSDVEICGGIIELGRVVFKDEAL